MTPDLLPERIARRIVVNETTGCWEWQGYRDENNYGRVRFNGKLWRLHRLAYTTFVGEIPDGLVVDHECHTADELCLGGTNCRHRTCCNPGHLRAIEQRDNVHRGFWRAKTHCPQGHPYSGDNVYIARRRTGVGARNCKICVREAKRRYRDRLRAAAS